MLIILSHRFKYLYSVRPLFDDDDDDETILVISAKIQGTVMRCIKTINWQQDIRRDRSESGDNINCSQRLPIKQ